MKRILTAFLAASFICALSAGAAHAQDASYKVVTNTSIKVTSISAKQLSRIFMKKTAKWADGTSAQPVDQADAPALSEAFSRGVHGKPARAISSYWQKMVFSGRMVPPPKVSGDDEVLAFVRSKTGAVGYVSSSASTEGVKVLQVNR
jgi:ABC-type phosphate transport system substrate-binding protein